MVAKRTVVPHSYGLGGPRPHRCHGRRARGGGTWGQPTIARGQNDYVLALWYVAGVCVWVGGQRAGEARVAQAGRPPQSMQASSVSVGAIAAPTRITYARKK